MYYHNKVILITGASSGIGKELAIQLAQQKAKLILVSRSEDALQEVRTQCLQYANECHILPFDLSQSDKIPSLATQVLSFYNRIDVLINNAGISQRSLVVDTEIQVDRYIMELDYFSVITLTKVLLPQFAQIGGGHIIVMSSVSGLMGFPMRSAYAAAKHALHGFFETLQTEKPIPNLYTTIVCPGRVNTPISLSAMTGNGKAHNVMDKGQQNGIPVADCVKKILKATQQKRNIIIIARAEKLLLIIKRIFPKWFLKIAYNKGMNPQ